MSDYRKIRVRLFFQRHVKYTIIFFFLHDAETLRKLFKLYLFSACIKLTICYYNCIIDIVLINRDKYIHTDFLECIWFNEMYEPLFPMIFLHFIIKNYAYYSTQHSNFVYYTITKL